MRRVISRRLAQIQLCDRPVQVLVSDPPWKFGDKIQGQRGAEWKYKCLPLDQIARFQLPELCAQSILFLWRVAAMQDEALFVCKAWGFRPYSEITWVKMTKHDKMHMGMGHVVRAAHESCLIGVRGRRLPPATLAERSVLIAKTGEHSEKPQDFYELVDRLYPDAIKHEMFARRTRPGWQQTGNQLGRLDIFPVNE